MCPNFGTPKIINFPFGTNGKLLILGVPILKHITVVTPVKIPNIKLGHPNYWEGP